MQQEIQTIISQLKEAFAGDPWFGRSVVSLLNDVNEEIAFEKPNKQHSILELVWHMGIWKEFAISRLKPTEKTLKYFEDHDWQSLDHSDKGLWQQGLQKLHQTQNELIEILKSLDDAILDQQVAERTYNFRKLLYGVIEHDIYHVGQIAYVTKMLHNK